MTGCRKHSAAKRDLVQHYIYLFDNAGLEVAERCLLQAQSAEPANEFLTALRQHHLEFLHPARHTKDVEAVSAGTSGLQERFFGN